MNTGKKVNKRRDGNFQKSAVSIAYDQNISRVNKQDQLIQLYDYTKKKNNEKSNRKKKKNPNYFPPYSDHHLQFIYL